MAFKNNQQDFPLPAEQQSSRTSAEFLPKYFRTDVNKKILAATLDQLINPGAIEKVNGFYGRRNSKAHTVDDTYIPDVSADRENYQFEPTLVIKDDLDNVTLYKEYRDLINQIGNFNGDASNHSTLFQQEYYSWDPHIDWDKFTNFREYYWLPNGPQTVDIAGQSKEITSTYTVTLQDNLDNFSYKFNEYGETNPDLKLFRGQTYRFEINSPGYPMSIALYNTWVPGEDPILDSENNVIGFSDSENLSTLYTEGVRKVSVDENGLETETDYVETGYIEFTVPDTAPIKLFYISKNDPNTAGAFDILNIDENTELNVEQEILNKKYYTTSGGWELSNGMKVNFVGDVFPEKYASNEWYVEGVGTSIKLINEQDLSIPSQYTENILVPFDTEKFDRVPFSDARGYAATKDYVVINRASQDRNPWSRYNRWFHRDVVEKSATINGTVMDLDQDTRAKRPIIEFESGLKLWKFGTQAKQDIDIIDFTITDVFSNVEGQTGYYVDGVQLTQGMRVLFAGDTDSLVQNKIYTVNFVRPDDTANLQIYLEEAVDADPLMNETVFVKNGTNNRGKIYYYNGNNWVQAQQKTQLNQSPRFDLFDSNGVGYDDPNTYPASEFAGNPVFSYSEGNGPVDDELGFPLTYRSLENSGDIVFEFNLTKDCCNYETEDDQIQLFSSTGYLRVYNDLSNFKTVNGWKKAEQKSRQYVIRKYDVQQSQTDFAVDVYDASASLNDIRIIVQKNNQIVPSSKYSVIDLGNVKTVRFETACVQGDVVILKTDSDTPKNSNGFYEIPFSLERNPKNMQLDQFTFGEVNDHVNTMIEDLVDFEGTYPGSNNLRDLGNISAYGKRFLQHSCPLNLPLYHLTNDNTNVINALRYAKLEYAKFKRLFLQTAESLGILGPVRQHVDQILKEINSQKSNSMPFYFSDMLAYGDAQTLTYRVNDSDETFFALRQPHSLNSLSPNTVYVYLNEQQLTHGVDYSFTQEGFVSITAQKAAGDIVELVQFETSDGSYIPPTPSKLGLYPKFVPEKYIDDTYKEAVEVIKGHDGSIVVAFGDYRDELLLELERRIFNNIKTDYDNNLIDVYDFMPGEYRDTGISKQSIDRGMIKDFHDWLQLVNTPDFTSIDFYDITDQFSYNYSNMVSPNGNSLTGYWRSVYKFAYDTDRPHTAPWEMLGYSIKPVWWNEVYGPAPYTAGNLILWQDLEDGAVREPGKLVVYRNKFRRPGLTDHIPVDDSGNLLSPFDSGYANNYVEAFARQAFSFGDESPVETAWRRSAEYPFALTVARLLNQPAEMFGKGFDTARQVRNPAGNIVYADTNLAIQLDALSITNIFSSPSRVQTAGLVNYIVDYVIYDKDIVYSKYLDDLSRIDNQLSIRIAGFTDKEKFKLILDSRTPFNEGNVFVPDENYQVFFNSSTPIRLETYSGIIVEKLTNGFRVSGYDFSNPNFTYKKPFEQSADPVINVGGVTETFVLWAAGNFYNKGTIVQFENRYFKTIDSHTSQELFDTDKFAPLDRLPVVGGRDARIRKMFEQRDTVIPYGTVFETVQEVADFIQGYAFYLEDRGFDFDFFNVDYELIENWRISLNEFLFWTTQNWNAGTIITLSPGANQLKFSNELAVVDNVTSDFYEYSLRKSDGRPLRPEFKNIYRQGNEFTISPKNSSQGLYHIKLPLVQKEHVILLDNTTVFNDVIYDAVPGYRQERIKVIGYKSTNWNGGFEIPGFIYDDVVVTEWQPWKDYSISQVVKYNEFYYVAQNNVPGSAEFNSVQWARLDSRPEKQLITNFDYKINQFADFYDLDTDNFDTEQQKFAQHLIGYQKRKYLENIINDEVSQYKFYQGFIQEKGTRNALNKLFDTLSSADQDSLEFYEEWAIRTGLYGAVNKFEEVEYIISEDKFKLSPQPFELVQNMPTTGLTDLVNRIIPSEVYLKPEEYDHKPFPEFDTPYYQINTSGYVREDDVSYRVLTKDEILAIDISTVTNKEYIWVVNDQLSWEVQEIVDTDARILKVDQIAGEIIIDLDTDVRYTQGDIVGLTGLDSNNGFFRVIRSSVNKVYCEVNDNIPFLLVENQNGNLIALRNARIENYQDITGYLNQQSPEGSKIWLDNAGDNLWAVLENNPVYNENQIITSQYDFDSTYHGFAQTLAADDTNQTVVFGTPAYKNGTVQIHQRPAEARNLSLKQELLPAQNLADVGEEFGYSVDLSSDKKYLVVGSPAASNVKTRFRNIYDPDSDYSKNDIVEYNEQFWIANRDILGGSTQTPFETFNAHNLIYDADYDSTVANILVTGYPGFSTTVDHLLIRAQLDAYQGTAPQDRLVLKYNNFTYDLNGDLTFRDPFAGQIAGIDSSTLTGEFVIENKVDKIIRIDSYVNLPVSGSKIFTDTGSANVVDVFFTDISVIMYLNDINGVFNFNDFAVTETGANIGTYLEVFTPEIENFGGYWKISVDEYSTFSTFTDVANGLVITDILKETETSDPAFYLNIMDTEFANQNLPAVSDRVSFITNLSYSGNPGGGEFVDNDSNLWTMRFPNSFIDNSESPLEPGDSFRTFISQRSFTDSQFNLTDYGLTTDLLNKVQTVYDIWDGYIEFNYDNFDLEGRPFEPKVGDVIRDLQIPFEADGTVSTTQFTNTSTAEVVYYQRKGTVARIYINVTSGNFNILENTARFRLERIADTNPEPQGRGSEDVNRVMGSVLDYNDDVVLPNVENDVGRFVIFEESTPLPVTEQNDLINAEYWIYETGSSQGQTLEPSVPGVENLDWTKTNRILATSTGTPSGLTQQGMVNIYELDRSNFYDPVVTIISPEFRNFERFGSKVKITKNGDLYTLFVQAEGIQTSENSGRIYLLKFGTEDSVSYDWEYSKDNLFKGQFESNTSYAENDIVIYQGLLYRAGTNIQSQTFNSASWNLVTDGTDYSGFVPNSLSTAYLGEEVYDPTRNIRRFGIDFDTDDTGQILAVSADEFGSPSPDSLRKVLIYRKRDRKFFLDQIIESNFTDTGFGDNIELSSSGDRLLISKPYNNNVPGNRGEVDIYIRSVVNTETGETEYRYSQTLTSPLGEAADKFGYQAQFIDNGIVVSAITGDKVRDTTFDKFANRLRESRQLFDTEFVNDPSSQEQTATTFDGEFTNFKSKVLDVGAIYVFEEIGNNLVFAENISSSVIQADRFFGENIVANKNHIYSAMPRLGEDSSYNGTIVDFRKKSNSFAWTKIRQPVPTVDLDQIKTAFLYNTRTKEIITYLDIIDPLQNRFAGIAEQEIDYKTYYDPALYNVGPVSEIVSDSNFWAENYVGKVWFDLSSIRVKDAYQGDVKYQANNWSTVLPRTQVNVYEWVETKLTPEQWDELSGTEEGFTRGVSGTTRYGNSLYSVRREYNSVSQTFTNTYYYWVNLKTTVPNTERRKLDTLSVANAISFPRETGLRFLALMSKDRFALYNCESLVNGEDTALHVSYYTTNDIDQNIHRDYQIVSEGLSTSKPTDDIETKWVDSLVGYDSNGRIVPDPALSAKEKYGTLFSPRQSWFVNKNEALKQVIERINAVIIDEILIDNYDLSKLSQKDPEPLFVSGQYDETIETFSELEFVGTARLQRAVLRPVIRDGQLTGVEIISGGRGYKNAPNVTIMGSGSGAQIQTTINNLGVVTAVTVVKSGRGYNESTTLSVRPYTVLVSADENIQNRWSLYVWDIETSVWSRTQSQSYDMARYWQYIDWYATGYSQYTKIDFVTDATYKLLTLDDDIGDVIKIENADSGGWVLLEKINNLDIPEYTVNYRTIGRQDGTVQFLSNLYDYQSSNIGYDNFSFDNQFYDRQPVEEIRILMDFVKNDLFVADLEAEYNKLFFSSIRYVFAEQPFVDWAFKTSFVKAKHNLGSLRQKITFNNDNLPSYQEYIEEAKPYKTQIREYVSAYDGMDNSNTTTTDFDLPPYYSEAEDRIINPELSVVNNSLVGVTDTYRNAPFSDFVENVGFEISEIILSDRGAGYTATPIVSLEGGGGTGAVAKAYLSAGKIASIQIINPGSGYLSAPTVNIRGSIDENGTPAQATAVLKNDKIRTASIKIKFDRLSGEYYIYSTERYESFTGTGSRLTFNLKWPLNLVTTSIKIEIDGEEQLKSSYAYSNVQDENRGLIGQIEFVQPPTVDSFVAVTYNVSAEYLSAEDRINQYYEPGARMPGKQLNQLMKGIDYGGVEVRSFGFEGLAGWDVDAWYSSIWDSYDNSFEDEIFTLDGSTTILELSQPFEQNVEYNIYRNGVRIDDPNFGLPAQTNPNAETESVIGDGTTALFNMPEAGIEFTDGDVIIIRKSTSDGSFLPEPVTFDTQLQGGDLQYSTASGINADDIIVDGDGFVTPKTSGKTEELVPGQVLDTLDIQVYTRETDGASLITTSNYTADGATTEYAIGTTVTNIDSVFVSVDGVLLNRRDDYNVDFDSSTVTFNVAPTVNSRINITDFGKNGQNILEINTVILDGTTSEIPVDVRFKDVASSYIVLDGESINSAVAAEDTGNNNSNTVIRLPQTPAQGAVLTYGLFYNTVKSFSEVSVDTFVGDGVTSQFTLTRAPFQQVPLRQNVVVQSGDTVLNAGYNNRYIISESRERTLEIQSWQQPSGFLDANDIEVYLNGVEIFLTVGWRLDVFNASIVLFADVGQPGDVVDVYITSDAEYTLNGTELNLTTAPAAGSTIKVYQFSNHDILGIQRFTYENVVRDTITTETTQYFVYNFLTNGLIKLRQPAVDSQYLWIVRDGKILIPDVDYTVAYDNLYVKLLENPDENTKIEVIHFSASKFSEGFAFRHFKDILNRTHYKKIDNSRSAVVTQPVNYYDLTIEVDDASALTEPNRDKNIPGVIFVNGERIEYFIKQGNVLRQLRRGTLGTGINELIPANTRVIDQGPQLTIPYKDEISSQVFTIGDAQTELELDFVPNTVDEIEVFKGGTRLNKTGINYYNPFLDSKSPEGDEPFASAEFFLNGSTLILNTFTTPGEKIVVVRKLGKLWTDNGESLSESDSNIANFLKS